MDPDDSDIFLSLPDEIIACEILSKLKLEDVVHIPFSCRMAALLLELHRTWIWDTPAWCSLMRITATPGSPLARLQGAMCNFLESVTVSEESQVTGEELGKLPVRLLEVNQVDVGFLSSASLPQLRNLTLDMTDRTQWPVLQVVSQWTKLERLAFHCNWFDGTEAPEGPDSVAFLDAFGLLFYFPTVPSLDWSACVNLREVLLESIWYGMGEGVFRTLATLPHLDKLILSLSSNCVNIAYTAKQLPILSRVQKLVIGQENNNTDGSHFLLPECFAEIAKMRQLESLSLLPRHQSIVEEVDFGTLRGSSTLTHLDFALDLDEREDVAEGLAQLTGLKSLVMATTRWGDPEDLAALATLTRLTHLDLVFDYEVQTPVYGRHLAWLTALTSLHTLRINPAVVAASVDVDVLRPIFYGLPALSKIIFRVFGKCIIHKQYLQDLCKRNHSGAITQTS